MNLVIFLEPSSNEADKGGKDPLNERNILSFRRRRSYEKGDRFKKFDYHVLIIVAIMDIRGFLTDSPMPPQRGSTSSEEDVIVRNEEPEAGAHPRCRPSSYFLSLSWVLRLFSWSSGCTSETLCSRFFFLQLWVLGLRRRSSCSVLVYHSELNRTLVSLRIEVRMEPCSSGF